MYGGCRWIPRVSLTAVASRSSGALPSGGFRSGVVVVEVSSVRHGGVPPSDVVDTS
jgi:hypothetical protein